MTRARLVALVAVSALAAAGAALRTCERVVVTGASMVPTLLPGDRLLVRRPLLRGRGRAPLGALVVVSDPRDPRRRVVKRLVGAAAAGAVVHGDNPAASTDSRTWGPVPWPLVHGTVVYRYAPAERAGRLRRSDGPRRRRRRAGPARPR